MAKNNELINKYQETFLSFVNILTLQEKNCVLDYADSLFKRISNIISLEDQFLAINKINFSSKVFDKEEHGVNCRDNRNLLRLTNTINPNILAILFQVTEDISKKSRTMKKVDISKNISSDIKIEVKENLRDLELAIKENNETNKKKILASKDSLSLITVEIIKSVREKVLEATEEENQKECDRKREKFKVDYNNNKKIYEKLSLDLIKIFFEKTVKKEIYIEVLKSIVSDSKECLASYEEIQILSGIFDSSSFKEWTFHIQKLKENGSRKKPVHTSFYPSVNSSVVVLVPTQKPKTSPSISKPNTAKKNIQCSKEFKVINDEGVKLDHQQTLLKFKKIEGEYGSISVLDIKNSGCALSYHSIKAILSESGKYGKSVVSLNILKKFKKFINSKKFEEFFKKRLILDDEGKKSTKKVKLISKQGTPKNRRKSEKRTRNRKSTPILHNSETRMLHEKINKKFDKYKKKNGLTIPMLEKMAKEASIETSGVSIRAVMSKDRKYRKSRASLENLKKVDQILKSEVFKKWVKENEEFETKRDVIIKKYEGWNRNYKLIIPDLERLVKKTNRKTSGDSIRAVLSKDGKYEELVANIKYLKKVEHLFESEILKKWIKDKEGYKYEEMFSFAKKRIEDENMTVTYVQDLLEEAGHSRNSEPIRAIISKDGTYRGNAPSYNSVKKIAKVLGFTATKETPTVQKY